MPHVFLPCIPVRSLDRHGEWIIWEMDGKKRLGRSRESSSDSLADNDGKSHEIEKLIESIISVIAPLRFSACFEYFFSSRLLRVLSLAGG